MSSLTRKDPRWGMIERGLHRYCRTGILPLGSMPVVARGILMREVSRECGYDERVIAERFGVTRRRLNQVLIILERMGEIIPIARGDDGRGAMSAEVTTWERREGSRLGRELAAELRSYEGIQRFEKSRMRSRA